VYRVVAYHKLTPSIVWSLTLLAFSLYHMTIRGITAGVHSAVCIWQHTTSQDVVLIEILVKVPAKVPVKVLVKCDDGVGLVFDTNFVGQFVFLT
jgi:hypothetical protein